MKFGKRFSPSPRSTTSKNGAKGSGLAVKTGPPPKTIGSPSCLCLVQIGIRSFSSRSSKTGPSNSQLKDSPNRSQFDLLYSL